MQRRWESQRSHLPPLQNLLRSKAQGGKLERFPHLTVACWSFVTLAGILLAPRMTAVIACGDKACSRFATAKFTRSSAARGTAVCGVSLATKTASTGAVWLEQPGAQISTNGALLYGPGSPS